MSFRKNGIMFLERQIGIYVALVVGICILLYDITFLAFFSIPLILLIGVLIMDRIQADDIITLDENGIVCCKKKNPQWEYQWSEIEELQISSRYRNPSVEIVLKPNCDKRPTFDANQHYFQLSIKAKKAIMQYYRWPLSRMN